MREAPSESEKRDVLSPQELSRLDAYWRAANYLSVGQIYLLDNALLRSCFGATDTRRSWSRVRSQPQCISAWQRPSIR